jgi:hypothetical protein
MKMLPGETTSLEEVARGRRVVEGILWNKKNSMVCQANL